MVVETANTNAWSTAKRRMAATDAHVFIGQEMHIAEAQIPDAQAWAAAKGWKALFAPAIHGRGEPEGPGVYGSGGLVIAVRDIFGLRPPEDQDMVISEGRALEVIVDVLGMPAIHVVSVYGTPVRICL